MVNLIGLLLWLGSVLAALVCVILRFRSSQGLDRLVSRTITYALVTAVLVVPYLLILPAATRLAGGSGSLAVAAVTLAAAAAFAPVRRRVQAVVDQTMQPTRSSLWLRAPARQEPLGG